MHSSKKLSQVLYRILESFFHICFNLRLSEVSDVSEKIIMIAHAGHKIVLIWGEKYFVELIEEDFVDGGPKRLLCEVTIKIL